MAQSFFTYNITRPYPYQWFTWVTIVGGIIFTVLFSLINYAAYGYELGIRYTTNPNQTFATTSKILNAWPFKYSNKVSASCEPATILTGAREYFISFELLVTSARLITPEFFTNQLGFLYTVKEVWQPAAEGGPRVLLPSFTYLNNTLDNCEIKYIQIELLAEDRTAEQFGWCQWGPSISAMAVCSLHNSYPTMMINVTTQYDLLPPTVGDGQQSYLLTLDPITKASLWWGASLISAYWMILSGIMQTNRGAGSDIRKGSINLQPSTNTDISSQDFFTVNYHFISETYKQTTIYITANSSVTPSQLIAGNATNPPANIWNSVDIYAKSFYSTVLADLGQTPGSTQPNLLTESYKDLLQNYTSAFENMEHRCNAANGPATLSFNDEAGTTNFGILEVTNSTIMQQYLCQVPQQKSTGTLVIAILSADLVFLQAL